MSRHVLRSTTVQGIAVMAGALIAPHFVAGADAVFLTVGLFAGLWALRGRLDASPLSWALWPRTERPVPESPDLEEETLTMPQTVEADDPDATRRKVDAVFGART